MSDHQTVDDAIASRRSRRAFLSKDISRSEVEAILQVAARAPSGTNMQPWKVYVVSGDTKTHLSDAVLAAFNDPEFVAKGSYKYYPDKFFEP